MEVAKGFLIGSDQENREVIGLVLFEVVEREDFGDVFLVDEAVDFPVTVAGDVGKNGTMAGFLAKAVDGRCTTIPTRRTKSDFTSPTNDSFPASTSRSTKAARCTPIG